MRIEDAPPIYVVDDNADMCKSIEALLTSAGYRVVTFDDPETFLKQAPGLTGGALLLDIRMPGINGLEVLTRLGADGHRFVTIMITAHADVSVAVEAMKSGAANFIQKPFRDDTIIATIEKELANFVPASPALRCNESLLDILTARERQVALCLARGLSNKQIAYELDISVRTVELHRSRAMQRLGCKTFADLLRTVLHVADGRIHD